MRTAFGRCDLRGLCGRVGPRELDLSSFLRSAHLTGSGRKIGRFDLGHGLCTIAIRESFRDRLRETILADRALLGDQLSGRSAVHWFHGIDGRKCRVNGRKLIGGKRESRDDVGEFDRHGGCLS